MLVNNVRESDMCTWVTDVKVMAKWSAAGYVCRNKDLQTTHCTAAQNVMTRNKKWNRPIGGGSGSM